MSAINIQILNSGDKTYLHANCIGNGAIAAGDDIVNNIVLYPLGSRYVDITNRIEYVRIAEAGVIGDWAKSAALTVLT